MIYLMNDPPVISFTPWAWLKLMIFAQSVAGEVSGLGVIVLEGREMVVQDVLLVPQVCTSGSTELEADGIASLLGELADEGLDVGNVRLWWHSHGAGGVYLSVQDRETLRDSFPQAHFMVGLVTNRRGDVFASLYQYQPIALVAEPLRVVVPGPDGRDLLEGARAEVACKVRTAFAPAIAAKDMIPGAATGGGIAPDPFGGYQ
ncbi:MAG: hypothetical protein ABSC13_04980 [Dehalococcoidia bacterium]